MITFVVILCCIFMSSTTFLLGMLIQIQSRLRLENTMTQLQELFTAMHFEPQVAEYLHSLGFSTNGASHVSASQIAGDAQGSVGR